MTSRLNPYLHFKNNAREAMEFYKTIFGGKLEITTFGEGMPHEGVDSNNVMHSSLEAENGITFMAADTPPGMEGNPGASISMSLMGDNETELRGYWDKLTEGGNVAVPFEKAPWGDTFGMLTDKFGIEWMVNVTASKA